MAHRRAAQAIYSSEWTIRRVERAEGGLKPLTVKSLLQAYVSSAILARQSRLRNKRWLSIPGKLWGPYPDRTRHGELYYPRQGHEGRPSDGK
jgi:hypothetical protein